MFFSIFLIGIVNVRMGTVSVPECIIGWNNGYSICVIKDMSLFMNQRSMENRGSSKAKLSEINQKKGTQFQMPINVKDQFMIKNYLMAKSIKNIMK